MDYRKLASELRESLIRIAPKPEQKKIDRFDSGETFLLMRLSEMGNAIPSELASQNKTSAAHIAKMLRRLEEKGEIVREIDKTDRRRIIVTITEKGQTRIEEATSYIINNLTALLEQLGEEDARNFVRIVAKIASLAPPMENMETPHTNE